ncbi:NAD(P)-dependent oxidoreductase [Saccharibacillus alkalitolerans]|uniref:NAD(P)H-binding protein n=1 Tax=Saccharibacillus alkalitolerans TaxID=2705290 RepID=A0ABX0FBL7_9BACL|nr:NAD(P)H-binding protein [Saccharibacillus alkalitolerans]NGZ77370.1 NAD(P)H-binding protein [Saccharibacillus alkalitolerans]
MKILVLGAEGAIGRRIVKEALDRKCEVTALLRDASLLGEERAALHVREGDLLAPGAIAEAAAGCEAILSAFGSEPGEGPLLPEAARMIVEGARTAGVERLIVAGGSGTLLAEPGVRLMDTPDYPAELRPLAQAHADAYEIFAASDLEWTYASPAAWIEPGRRTGNFRIGTVLMVTDEEGHSRISVEDFAAAVIDELDDPNFIRSRFTVAY